MMNERKNVTDAFYKICELHSEFHHIVPFHDPPTVLSVHLHIAFVKNPQSRRAPKLPRFSKHAVPTRLFVSQVNNDLHLGFRYSKSLLAISANRLARHHPAKTTDGHREAAPRCFVDEGGVLLSDFR